MSESIFDKRSLTDVHDEIRKVYLSDNRPWIIGFSGGKDSTCLVQLVWNALSELPKENLQKKIYVISSDTLVESPQISERIIGSLDKIEKIAKGIHLPISTNLLRPKLSDTFWVRLLGLGYPAPTPMFRWCTDMLKITNADRFIQEKVSEYGEAIVLLGMRKTESISRHQTMNLYKIKSSLLSRHSKFPQTYVYTPICKTKIHGVKKTEIYLHYTRTQMQVNVHWWLIPVPPHVVVADLVVGLAPWLTNKIT